LQSWRGSAVYSRIKTGGPFCGVASGEGVIA
jgi:hypothetical protein